MEAKLWEAARDGRVEEVKEILRGHPSVNVNWGDGFGWTALHFSCARGHDYIFAILLAHARIDVNLKTNNGSTPFLGACQSGKTSCVRMLLRDSRVRVNEPSNDGYTPLWYAAYFGYVEVIRRWIASGREMGLGQSGNPNNDAIWTAKRFGRTEAATLLERFKLNPAETRDDIRNELVSEVFALVVFVSDGLLEVCQTEMAPIHVTRFFKIATQLPLELQMVLCNRVLGFRQEIIPGKGLEAAFKNLVKLLL